MINFFLGNKKRGLNNANKQMSILNQIAALTQTIREKKRKRAEYIRELQKNNLEKKSVSLKDKIIDGVSSFLSYFMPEFLKKQNNINLRITETDKEINESKKELEIMTNSLLQDNTNNTIIRIIK